MPKKKRARDMTTEEIAARLFPPEVRDYVKRVAHEPKPKRQRKSSQDKDKGE